MNYLITIHHCQCESEQRCRHSLQQLLFLSLTVMAKMSQNQKLSLVTLKVMRSLTRFWRIFVRWSSTMAGIPWIFLTWRQVSVTPFLASPGMEMPGYLPNCVANRKYILFFYLLINIAAQKRIALGVIHHWEVRKYQLYCRPWYWYSWADRCNLHLIRKTHKINHHQQCCL